jgi:hypothetical protein
MSQKMNIRIGIPGQPPMDIEAVTLPQVEAMIAELEGLKRTMVRMAV